MEGHQHSATCGCKEYLGAENAGDLLAVINIEAVKCLNQRVPGSAKTIFKSYEERFDKSRFVASDEQGQLLLIIPFISQVKIKSIGIIAKSQSNYPRQMGLYINEQNADFSLIDSQPLQQFPLLANLDGLVYNAVKQTKFNKVNSLQIYLHSNDPKIQISYIHIKGQNTGLKRQIVKAVYEIQPNAKKNDIFEKQTNNFQMH